MLSGVSTALNGLLCVLHSDILWCWGYMVSVALVGEVCVYLRSHHIKIRTPIVLRLDSAISSFLLFLQV